MKANTAAPSRGSVPCGRPSAEAGETVSVLIFTTSWTLCVRANVTDGFKLQLLHHGRIFFAHSNQVEYMAKKKTQKCLKNVISVVKQGKFTAAMLCRFSQRPLRQCWTTAQDVSCRNVEL